MAGKKKSAAVIAQNRAVGTIIRMVREFQGLTQGELGDRLGWDARIVRKIENMQRAVSAGEVILLAIALGCEMPGELLDRAWMWGRNKK